MNFLAKHSRPAYKTELSFKKKDQRKDILDNFFCDIINTLVA